MPDRPDSGLSNVAARLQATSRAAVAGAVVASPWLFGSVEPWAYLTICLAAGFGTVAWLGAVCMGSAPTLRVPAVTVALGCLAAVALVQMLPLPLLLIAELSPLSITAYEHGERLARDASTDESLPVGIAGSRSGATLSVSPASTRRSLSLFVACVGVFLVAANAFRRWSQLRRAALAVAVSGSLVALVGILQRLSGTERIYWFHLPRFPGSIFGTFTNANHCGAYLNMALAVALGLLLATPRPPSARASSGVARLLLWLSTSHGSLTVLLALAVVTMATAVCLTLSRGAVVSLAVGALVTSAWVGARGSARLVGKWACTGALLVGVCVFWLGWRPVVRSLGSLRPLMADPLHDARAVATRDTLRLFRLSPAGGIGFGAFEHAFPLQQSAAIRTGRWLHAHNDYAQLLAEAGAAGAVLAVFAGVALVWSTAGKLSAACRPARSFVTGASVGLGAIAVHSAFDFSLHKPANAFLLALLCGMCVAAVHLPAGGAKSRTLAARTASPSGSGLRRSVVRLTAGGAVIGVVALAVVAVPDIREDLAFARFRRMERMADGRLEPAPLESAVGLASAEAGRLIAAGADDADALWAISEACRRWARDARLDPRMRLRIGEQAIGAAALAAVAAPSDCRLWLCLARAQATLGLWPQASRSLRSAQAFAPPETTLSLEGGIAPGPPPGGRAPDWSAGRGSTSWPFRSRCSASLWRPRCRPVRS